MTAQAPTGYGRLEIAAQEDWLEPHRGSHRRRAGMRRQGRRYLAFERARTRRHAVPAVLVVPAVASLNVLAMAFVGSEALTLTLAAQGTLGVLALAGHILLRGPLRTHPSLVVGLIATGSSVSSAFSGLAEPALTWLAAGWLLVIPLGVALLIPWRPLSHAIWLMVNSAIALPAIMVMPGLSDNDRFALAVTALATTGISLAGNLLHEREDKRAFALREALIARRAELADVNRALHASLRHDPLTGARNRIRLAEDLVEARAGISRSGESWALLAIDIDHFKRINDHFGHAAGDRVLAEVVRAMREALRPMDGVYRTGGEEFFVLLPRATEGEAFTIADRLRHNVRRLALANPGNPPLGVVTVSIGIAMLGPEGLGADDDSWLARADGALYSAKAGGRNRTEIAGPTANLKSALRPLPEGGGTPASPATWPTEGELAVSRP
ncbi:MAG TPA: GGDEF domain-containing protein [Candidatus Limnocylindrales bacterium]|nr:GGDEF domain-containing protein [Candidatus Limnocylindrales bacterium]